jgi:hypothetical protein
MFDRVSGILGRVLLTGNLRWSVTYHWASFCLASFKAEARKTKKVQTRAFFKNSKFAQKRNGLIKAHICIAEQTSEALGIELKSLGINSYSSHFSFLFVCSTGSSTNHLSSCQTIETFLEFDKTLTLILNLIFFLRILKYLPTFSLSKSCIKSLINLHLFDPINCRLDDCMILICFVVDWKRESILGKFTP